MASPWIDVSVTLRTGMVNWPGDPPVRFSHALSMERGDPATVSLLEMGAHTGTHMDAPAHFVRGGIGIDEMPVDTAIGSAWVIPIRDRESVKVEELVEHLIRRRAGPLQDLQLRALLGYRQLRRGLRVPLRYGGPVSRRASGGAGRESTISPSAVFARTESETHQALLNAGVWIVEGLDLRLVRPGRVELVCLPIKIGGGDGAPARALVRQLNDG